MYPLDLVEGIRTTLEARIENTVILPTAALQASSARYCTASAYESYIQIGPLCCMVVWLATRGK